MSSHNHPPYINFAASIASEAFSLLQRLLGYETDSSLQSKSASSEPNAQNILDIQREKKTLTSYVLTPELLDAHKDIVTDFGFSLFEGLKQGLDDSHPTSSTLNGGFAVPDEQFYSRFPKVMDPLMHHFSKEFVSNLYGTRINKSKIRKLPDFGSSESRYIISCRIRVLRSISGYPFTWACNEKQRNDVEKVVRAVLPKLKGKTPTSGICKGYDHSYLNYQS